MHKMHWYTRAGYSHTVHVSFIDVVSIYTTGIYTPRQAADDISNVRISNKTGRDTVCLWVPTGKRGRDASLMFDTSQQTLLFDGVC